MTQLSELPVTRREANKRDRRQAIVEAARASFLEHGYAGTSMSGLLKILGGSKATLWGYFRSKEELFAAVVADLTGAFREELMGVLSSDGDLEATLTAFCRAFIRKIGSPDALATWRLVVAESGRLPEVGRIFYEQAAKHTALALSQFVAHHIAQGNLRDGNPERMAATLIDMCAGRQTRRLWGVSDPLADEDSDATEFTRVFLRAYRVDAAD